MSQPLSLDLEQLEVTSFEPSYTLSDREAGGAQSAPDMCTCIDICSPSEDLYCSGGC